MKAYKVFDKNWICNPDGKPFQYEIGKTYEIKETPILCKLGFHACKNICDCFTYYSFDPKNKVAEVELGGIILGLDGDKQCAQIITIVKEITWNEMLILANTGKENTGYRNSGDSNSGDSNSGDSNSGYSNSGNSNSGYSNSGDSNSGYSNSGNSNSGNRNNGDFNSTTPDIANFFNKPCKISTWNNAIKPYFIYNICLTLWIEFDNMSDQEKIDNKNSFVTNGYLKTFTYKEAWANAYKNATKEDIKLLKALPNWDPIVFEEITGIKID